MLPQVGSDVLISTEQWHSLTVPAEVTKTTELRLLDVKGLQHWHRDSLQAQQCCENSSYVREANAVQYACTDEWSSMTNACTCAQP